MWQIGKFKRCLYVRSLYFSFVFSQATLRLEWPFKIPSWAKVARLLCPSTHIISHLTRANLKKKAWPAWGHSPPEAVPEGDS